MKTTTMKTTTTTITTTTTTITTTTPATTTATTTTPGAPWSQRSECDCETGTRTRHLLAAYATRTMPSVPMMSCSPPGGVYVNDSIVVCGGGAMKSETPCFKKGLKSNVWDEIMPLKRNIKRFSMNVVGEAIVVVGGFKKEVGPDVEVLKDGRWIDGPSLHEHGIEKHCSVSYGDSSVLVIGGEYGAIPSSTVQSVNINTFEVTPWPSLNDKRTQHACNTAVWEGINYIVVAGGFLNEYSVCNTVEIIKACDGQYVWQSRAPMKRRRFSFGLSMFGSQLAAFGGEPKGDGQKEIEVYNFEQDQWILTGVTILNTRRTAFTTVQVPREKILENLPKAEKIIGNDSYSGHGSSDGREYYYQKYGGKGYY